jgi:hypothetical protein
MGAQQTAFDFVSASQPPAVAQAGEQRLQHLLAESLHTPVVLTFTDNTRTMITARLRNGITHVRLHDIFAGADDDTARAIARFLAGGQGEASRQLQRFIETRGAHIDPPRRQLLRTPSSRRAATAARADGEHHHDLEQILAEINVRYFATTVQACIGWARMGRGLGRRRKRRSIKLGSYLGRARSIRIHPVLDASWVPRFFVEYIVYHEMLHDVLGMPVMNGRRRLHGPDFRARERMFDRYAEAIAWERANLERLLSG